MKDRYIVDAQLRHKKNATFTQFSQETEDVFRKAYPDKADIQEGI